MIDVVTAKQQGAGMRDRTGRKPRTKHYAINLPMNLPDSDNESEGQISSEGENDLQKGLKGTGHTPMDNLSCTFYKLVIDKKKITKAEAVRKLSDLVFNYTDDLIKLDTSGSGWRSRGPIDDRPDKNQKKKPYDASTKRGPSQHNDMTVLIPHLNVGKAVVQNSVPAGSSNAFRNLPSEPELNSRELVALVNAIEDVDFLASFKKLSEEEVEDVFNTYLSETGNQVPKVPTFSAPAQIQSHPVQIYVSSDTSISHTVTSHMPFTSPLPVDQYDSSYETGSPSSSAVTSPGSPAALFSPPRFSTISESSHHELDPYMDSSRMRPMANVMAIPSTNPLVRCVNLKPGSVPKSHTFMRPLGEVVTFNRKSATERLRELQSSNSFFIQHFSIQLVRVIMSAKGKTGSEKVEEFSKSLMTTMKIKLAGKRPREGDIWVLSILAHIQFLLARVAEYRPALLVKDENRHSLLYIAAIEQKEKPLIARYIIESMYKVGFNPLQIDDKGNTILHLLAELGDSHVHVLSEVLMACDSVHTVNKVQETALHVAVRSPNLHLTTVLTLLKMRLSPLQKDARGISALQYHIQQLVHLFPRPMEGVEVIRKMLQSLQSLDTQTLLALNCLIYDASVPSDIKVVISEEVGMYGVKDLRLKKVDKRTMAPSYN